MSERVVPVLRLAVLCEDVVYDGEGEPFALEVPTHTLRLSREAGGRLRVAGLKLYVQLSDGVGTFFVTADIRTEAGTAVFRTRPPVEAVFDGTTHRAIPMELVLDMSDIVLPGYGLYEVRVFCNHACLHDPRERIPVPYPTVRLTVLSPAPEETDR